MECLWRLFSHRQPDGYCHQPDPAVFHVHDHPHDGLSHHYLHGPRFLEKYAPLYLGSQAESLVLPLNEKPVSDRPLSYRIF